MIDELHVADIALIRTATMAPSRGLTVVTGETGAGKTALLSALKLLSGERADAQAVREGAEGLSVSGRFFIDAPNDPFAVSDPTYDGLVATRTVSADGRSRVTIDGALASVGELAQVVGSTIDLVGQHEHQRLLKPSTHRAILDAWGGSTVSEAQANWRECFAQACAAADAVEAVRAAGQMSQAQIEQARYTLRRIDEVAPEPGEYEALAADVPKAENAEALLRSVGGAHEALAGEGGAIEAIGQAASLLESMASVDKSLAHAAESLREASYVVEDVARDVRSYAESVDHDAGALAAKQDRMGAIQGLLRTWGPTIDQVLEARAAAQDALDAFDSFDERLREATDAQRAAEERLAQAAHALHDARAACAPRFAHEVNAQMAYLELGSAQLECAVSMLERDQWSTQGPDAVEFMFRPGTDMGARPLARIASGGEVSRVVLAIKVVLGAADDADTLVFDEVDAGVGGSSARALAEVLSNLARTHQVIVVTHLAQVAVRADAHYVVRKAEGPKPQTTIEPVEGEARVAEVARMLSGDASAASLIHARQMLA